ncbi:Abi family protein [Enterococcus faecalis]|uniref:Abi family protein n=2 Tax=Enterococcus faecalis TaxID=1351 RepID=UPI000DBAF128|nr:Abi family protein [Enterococcus faecalis]MCU2263656.1 Abi family protein [Enterococcus faecalis]MCU9756517.1 Abi family protein [Enterococcus faecalis]MCU9775232.1 Abi family protein [Enterococcus faecalis]MCU9791670.1 Abi family protein [Enterococcus faecalis]MED7680728.1 Abi family protein [Enterococcus faecalis]
MGIKLVEDRLGLVNKLLSRKLNFDEEDVKDYLKKNNYFNVINGLETLLLPQHNSEEKIYDTETFSDFKAVYEFDKEISSIILKKLNEVESMLKTSISTHFANIHCVGINNTMQYTNKDNYMNPSEINPNSPNYCIYSSSYPFKNEQNKNIYDCFNSFVFFKPYYLTNLIDKNDHISKNFYRDTNYQAPQGVALYGSPSNRTSSDLKVAVPLWVAIETLTFGEVHRLVHYLQDDVLIKVMADFSLDVSKRNQFLTMLDILLALRNSCAHVSLVNRFRTQGYLKLNSDVVNSFELTPKETNPYAIIRLYDVLKILRFFVGLSELKKPFKKIIYRNNKKFKRRTYDLNHRLLERMGNDSYKEWKEMFSNSLYTIS